MILLKEIQLNSFLSHSKTKIEFRPDQHLLIDGKSGSGKSSIVEGLIWALYGRGRSDNRALIKRGSAKATVTILLTDDEDNKEYKIERSITEKNKHELKVSEKEEGKKFTPIKTKGTRETQDYLEKEILHSSYILFINSIVYPQENVENFVKQNASKRKDIILEIIKASDYDAYLKKAKDELQKIKTTKEVLLSKIEGEQEDIANNEKVASKLKEYEQKEEELKKEIDTLKAEYKKHTDRQQEIEGKKSDIKVTQGKLEIKLEEHTAKGRRLEELNKKIIELSKVDMEDLKAKVELLDTNKKALEQYNAAKDKMMSWSEKYTKILNDKPAEHDYEPQITEINQNLIKMINETAPQCPKCGYIDTDWAETHQEGVKRQEELLRSTQDKLEAHKKLEEKYKKDVEGLGSQPMVTLSNEDYAKVANEVERLEESERELIRAQTSEKEKDDAAAEIGVVNAERINIAEEIETMEKEIAGKDFSEEERTLKEKIIKINGKIDELLIVHSNNKELLGVARHASKKVIESKEKLKEHKTNLTLAETSIEAIELVKEAFGPNGVKAIVIDYVIPQLEDKINNILSQLSNFRVRLETQKSGLGKDTVLEGLFIDIINDQGEVLDFSSYSGGEKLKIIVSISEALSEIQKIGFRILDELFIGLDEESVDSFIQIMVTLQERFSQLICISHLRGIKETFEEKILITKTNGNSIINL